MLRSAVIPEVLKQATGNGVTNAFFMTTDGAMLGSCGDIGRDERVVGAIVANIWQEYERSCCAICPEASMEAQIFGFANGQLAVAKVLDRFLVCVYGNSSAHTGMLRTKLQALKDYLHEPLSELAA